MKSKRISILKFIIHGFSLAGFAHLIIRFLDGASAGYLLRQSGDYTIYSLFVCLACTPLYILFGWQTPRRLKKITGIYSFLFLVVHLGFYSYKLDWRILETAGRILGELNLILGTISLLMMGALFATSNRSAIRKMKKKWKPLHRLIYPATILACAHVALIDDQFNAHGVKYVFIATVLLSFRLPFIKQFFFGIRDRRLKNALKTESSPRKSVRPVFNSSLIVIPALLMSLAIMPSQVDASEPYHYSKDKGFFSTLFAPEELPTVNHEPTQKQCGNSECHEAYMPGLLPERSWKKIIADINRHHDEELSIEPEILQSIEAYLTSNAADYTESSTSMKILDSIGEETPIRISETPYMIEKHEDIPQEVIDHEEVLTISNCRACHIGSEESGSYNHHDVQMPGEFGKRHR